MPFHPEQLEAVTNKIRNDLSILDLYGSIKLYLCFYDQYLIPDSEWKGVYPCSDKTVSLHDVLTIVKEVMVQPHIVRHNVIAAGPMPAYMSTQSEAQNECEKYVEVCLIQNGITVSTE